MRENNIFCECRYYIFFLEKQYKRTALTLTKNNLTLFSQTHTFTIIYIYNIHAMRILKTMKVCGCKRTLKRQALRSTQTYMYIIIFLLSSLVLFCMRARERRGGGMQNACWWLCCWLYPIQFS